VTAVGRTTIVGDGGWGTAMALHLFRMGRPVAIWAHDREYARHLREHRANPRYLPGYPIPEGIEISSEIDPLLAGTDLLVSAVPTQFLRTVWASHAPRLPDAMPVLSLSKGVEQGTLLRPSQVIAEAAGRRPLAVLSGPNIAWEIARGLPAAAVVASEDGALADAVQERFSGASLRVYTHPDAVGVELGGALKNVIALAAGICDGMGLGQNAKAALVTRGVIELARLGEALGGDRRTFFGLSGLGDLLTTCYSPTSRNRTFGERVGRGERPEDVARSSAQIAEGVETAGPVCALGRREGLARGEGPARRGGVADGARPPGRVARPRIGRKRSGPHAPCGARGPTEPDAGSETESSRPSRGLRRGATCATASRRPAQPSLGVARRSGDTAPTSPGRAWVAPDPHGVSTPSGLDEADAPEPACAGRGPPLRFRSPSEVHRRTPTPSRRANRHGGRCFLSWAFVPYDTCRDAGPA
jgi:glycerol-3-phosphate dehydrogenase (NAD(P)+)